MRIFKMLLNWAPAVCAEHESVTLDDLVVALDQEIGVLAVASAVVELPGHVFEVQRGPAEGRHDLDGDVVVGLARHRAVGGMVLLLGLILSV